MKLKKTLVVAGIGILTLATAQLLFSDKVWSDEDKPWKRRPGVAPVSNQQYAEECGACHFAYQPGWLPARSWKRLMNTLDDHFDENAELSDDVQDDLTEYLVSHGADDAPHRRSRKLMRSLSNDETPLRITRTPYFEHEHHELPDRLVAGNAKVGSLSNCSACHRRAEGGSFSEREIDIPGYGRWDD